MEPTRRYGHAHRSTEFGGGRDPGLLRGGPRWPSDDSASAPRVSFSYLGRRRDAGRPKRAEIAEVNAEAQSGGPKAENERGRGGSPSTEAGKVQRLCWGAGLEDLVAVITIHFQKFFFLHFVKWFVAPTQTRFICRPFYSREVVKSHAGLSLIALLHAPSHPFIH